jgi:two-component system CheB/CheR fusion protein
MVVFKELPQPAEPEQKPQTRLDEGDYTERTAKLEQELMRLRQDYRSTVEELQTSNEELQSSNEELHSSNEELQSTNEELESSREELHSLNEELNTVNSELNSKVEELRDAYSAINSVLNSTQIAIVFLDNELRVSRFTSEAEKLLNVIDSDLGRPIDHIAHNLEYENLVERARQALKNLSAVDEEVQTEDGHWYRMRIMVHRPKEHVIEGVVLTFINIDKQKEAQQEIEEIKSRDVSAAKRLAESVVDTVRESLLVLDSEMRVVTANRSFYETFGATAHETEGKSLFELGEGHWDIPELRTLLHEIVEKDETLQDFLIEHRFPEVGFKRMMVNARMLREEDKEGNRILLAVEDVTNNLGSSMEEKK